MPATVYAFSRALLAYNSSIPQIEFSKAPGDKHLFAVIMSRVVVSEAERRIITASKLAAEAEGIGMSGRTAIRLCREMIDGGYLAESDSPPRNITTTAQGRRMWAENVRTFTEELRKSGYFDSIFHEGGATK